MTHQVAEFEVATLQLGAVLNLYRIETGRGGGDTYER